ncbi:hypothetical protein MKW92_047596 [Papaver armeniacum]|nr:hypothetical protein MKW92_047596 [Papaver armeniacum]
MKYLEFTNLDWINQFLNYVSFGEYCIKGSLEAYSCKHTGTDKKLSFSLDQEILDYLGQSADSDPPSPASILSNVDLPGAYAQSHVSRLGFQISVLFIYNGLGRRILGNAMVSLYGDVATRFVSSFFNNGSVVRSAVQAHRFFREEDWTIVKQTYDTYMFEVAKVLRWSCNEENRRARYRDWEDMKAAAVECGQSRCDVQ